MLNDLLKRNGGFKAVENLENKFINTDFIKVAPYKDDQNLYAFIKKFDDSCSWIESYCQLSIKGRISEYRKILDTYDRIRGGFTDELYKFIHAVSEVHKINQIYVFLKNQTSDNFKSTVNKSIYGKTYFFDDDETYKDDQSRNFLFELVTAANYQKLGYNVDLSGITDILIHEQKIAIECKKIHSKDKILTRVSDAIKQINKYKAQYPDYSGVIHIDITNCFDIKFQKIVSDASQSKMRMLAVVPNESDMIEMFEKKLESQRNNYINEIIPQIKEKIKNNTIGVVLHHSTGGFDVSLINERVVLYDCGYFIYDKDSSVIFSDLIKKHLSMGKYPEK